MAECYFKLMGRCSEPKNQVLTSAGKDRIQSIINASRQRGDTLPTDLELFTRDNKDFSVQCHRSCVSTYTSKYKIKLLQNKQRRPTEQPAPKRTRLSQTHPQFNFQEHCIFCGEECTELKDSKHPKRWRPVSCCRTIDSGATDKSFKDAILQVCHDRNDQWSKDVELRVLGAVSDLHAADAGYHRDCRPSFMGSKSSKTSTASASRKDPALLKIIDEIEADVAAIHE